MLRRQGALQETLKKKSKKERKRIWNPKINQIEAQITILNNELKNGQGDGSELKQKLRTSKKWLRDECDSSMKEQLSQRIKNSSNSVRETWKIIGELKTGEKEKENQITLVNGNVQISSSLEVANTFNDYYINLPLTITGQLHKDEYQFDLIESTAQTIYLSPCTSYELIQTINDMSNKFSSGVDEISNNILKASKTSITVPLVHIINISMDRGIFPCDLKKTIVKSL